MKVILPPKKKYKLSSIEKKIEKEKHKKQVSEILLEDTEKQKIGEIHPRMMESLNWKIKLHEKTITRSIEKINELIEEYNLTGKCVICNYKVIANDEYFCRKGLNNECGNCPYFEAIV